MGSRRTSLPLLLLVPVLGLAGWQASSGKTESKERPPEPAPITFELTAETEIKSGIRLYPETVYTYSQTLGGQKQQRWVLTLNDKYAHHWISPSGLVWVVTESMVGPGGAARIWARDANADLKGQWGFSNPDRSSYVRGQLPPKPTDELDLAKSGATQIKSGVELLTLVFKNGAERRIYLLETGTGTHSVTREFLAGQPKEDLLAKYIESSQQQPYPTWPVDRFPMVVWKGDFNKVLVHTFQWPGHEFPLAHIAPKVEREMPLAPALVKRTPSGKLLWFEFSDTINRGARLRVMDGAGKDLKVFDLLELGDFQSPSEAQRQLRYQDVLVHRGGTYYVPLDQVDWYGGEEAERLEMWDRSGRRFILTIGKDGDGHEVQAQVLQGQRARETVEPTYPAGALKAEKKYESASGQFVLRLRELEVAGKKQWQSTLLAREVTPEGPVYIELWSRPSYQDPIGASVSESGRVFMLQAGTTEHTQTGKVTDYAILVAWEPDGKQLTGLNLLDPKEYFATLSEAEKGVLVERIAFEYEGSKAMRKVNGLSVPRWQTEHFTVPLADGREKRYSLVMQHEHMTLLLRRK